MDVRAPAAEMERGLIRYGMISVRTSAKRWRRRMHWQRLGTWDLGHGVCGTWTMYTMYSSRWFIYYSLPHVLREGHDKSQVFGPSDRLTDRLRSQVS